MATEIGKVINIYEHCLSLMMAKNQIFIDNQNGDQLIEPILSNRFNEDNYQTLPKNMIKCIQLLLRTWNKQYYMFYQFKSKNAQCIAQIEFKLKQLKSNTSLLSKQYQLISDMQEQIKRWNKIADPLVYYDLKKRSNLKQSLQRRIQQIKNNLNLTKKSQTPIYMRKIEQQLKTKIYSVYLKQCKIDQQAIQKAASSWQRSVQFTYSQKNKLKGLNFFKYISESKNQFYSMFYDLLNKRLKLNHASFLKYYQQVNNFVKFISRFWVNYLRNLQQFNSLLQGYLKIFNFNKQNLQIRQSNVIKLFEKTNNTVNNIFKIDTSLRIIASLHLIFEIIRLQLSYNSEYKSYRLRLEAQSKQQSQICKTRKIIFNQYRIRQKQFYVFCADDKKFIEGQAKSQIVIQKKLIDSCQLFLAECHRISKQSHRIFLNWDQPVYELYQVSSLLSRQFANSAQSEKNFSKSQFSTLSQSQKSSSKNNKNQKLIQIQEFINKITVFNPDSINWHRNNVFSCALGPRFLLHGTIAALQDGLYFQSMFNKKNLFFGKTKLFIPRSDIVQIGTKNTLIIFPDAVQVKTQAGQIYFHSLGNRQTINNTLNEIYFPQNNPNSDQTFSLMDFNQVNQAQLQIYNQNQISQCLKKYELTITQHLFQNVKLNKFYKRYFSDQKFQIKGQQYDNFKTYILLQVEAIQPKNTPLTPEPPSYFLYKAQQAPSKSNPKISQRIHTYRKTIPKIPFLSSGGQGFCQDRQVYNWISDKILVIDTSSTVKGFSLTEGMEIKLKMICKEQQKGVHFSISAQIFFASDSASNNLLKSPAISNIKSSMVKMVDIMQKYQKGKKQKKTKVNGQDKGSNSEVLQQKVEKLTKQNQRIKKYYKLSVLLFVVVYLTTIILIKI